MCCIASNRSLFCCLRQDVRIEETVEVVVEKSDVLVVFRHLVYFSFNF